MESSRVSHTLGQSEKIGKDTTWAPSCFWCERPDTNLEDDHVFPRAIGGTKELSVRSCRPCQTALSKAELALSRKSTYAMHLLEAGPRGRDRRRDAASGQIEAEYVLVPHPLGGYNESAFRAGAGEFPIALPYVEINVSDSLLTCRRRAPEPAEMEKLVGAVERMLASKPDEKGLLCEISVLTHDLGEVGKDPDFWPRIVLDLRGRLFIRARNPEEALKFMSAFTQYLQAGAFKDYSRWVTGPPISGSTPHQVMIVHDRYMVGRVFAKIACSLAFITIGEQAKQLSRFEILRSYALGGHTEVWEGLVRELRFPGTLKYFGSRHIAALTSKSNHMVALVSLCGGLELIDLGEMPASAPSSLNALASSEIDGTKTQLLPTEETGSIFRNLLAELESAEREGIGLGLDANR